MIQASKLVSTLAPLRPQTKWEPMLWRLLKRPIHPGLLPQPPKPTNTPRKGGSRE